MPFIEVIGLTLITKKKVCMKTIPNKFISGACIFMLSFVLFACSNNSNTPTDTPTTGIIEIAVDESFKPIMEAEIGVFEGLYRDASIIPNYLPETESIKLLLDDSVRMIVVSRDITENEKKYFEAKKFFPKTIKIASDGIAFILHKDNPDSIFTTKMISGILTGKYKYWNEIFPKRKKEEIKVVFDNPNSGTVHYALDSICNGEKFSSQVSAVETNTAVIDFVKNNPFSIGIIGGSWISDRDDTTSLSFLKVVKVASISKEAIATTQNSFAPYQAYVALHQYPYVRDIYIILTDPRSGLATGFTSFITSDRGQRIILKYGIVPETQPLRIVNVRDEL